MRFGLNLPVMKPTVTPGVLAGLARRAEKIGFSELFLGEHVVLFDEQVDRYPGATGQLPAGRTPFPVTAHLPDPLVTHAFLAAVTERIRLATGIVILPQRNPIYAAKEWATLDWLSGGRTDVGVGVGWSRLEYAAVGVPFDRRGDRYDEMIAVMRALWAGAPADHHGEIWDFSHAHQYPQPVQRPGPPIWFGGKSEVAMRRVATTGDGWYVFNVAPEWLASKSAHLRDLLAEVGRSPGEITVSVGTSVGAQLTTEVVAAYGEAGADMVAVSLRAESPALLLEEVDAVGAYLIGATVTGDESA